MAVLNTYITDTFIRRQLYIERLKAGQNSEYSAVTAALVVSFRIALSKLDVDAVSDLNVSQFNRFISELKKIFVTSFNKYSRELFKWLEEFSVSEAKHSNTAHSNALAESPKEGETYEQIWNGVRLVPIAAIGLTIGQILTQLRKSQLDLFINRIKIARARKLTLTQLKQSIIGTSIQLYKDGIVSTMERGVRSIINTLIQHGANIARLSVAKKYLDFVLGYEWVSVLDNRTSSTCRSLDGRFWAIGKGPIPPIHLNCRSHIETVFSSKTRFKRGEKRKTDQGLVSTGETYYTWLKKQSASFQDDILGTTRGKLFRDGGVSATQFGKLNLNKNFEPLTLDELRKKNPQMFDSAGIDD